MAKRKKPENRYKVLIERIFLSRWRADSTELEFERSDIEAIAKTLKIELPKNLGDIVYSFRFRVPLPDRILETQPEGLEWTIRGAGKSKYRFQLTKVTRIEPNLNLVSIEIPDSTPELIRAYALGDEQALLAILRYNRLIDTFLGLTTYSLQSHLRTTVKDIGQIEIDELYIGLDKHGCHYVIPVQAKGGRDQIGVVQVEQDLAFATETFPGMRCKPIAAQFLSGGVIALFELTLDHDSIKIVEERHYKLVLSDQLDQARIKDYRT